MSNKIGSKLWTFLVLLALFFGATLGGMLMTVGNAPAAFSSWRYNTSDLGGDTNCVQDRVDELDDRVDVIEGGSAALTGASVAVSGAVSGATVTSSGRATIGTFFGVTPQDQTSGVASVLTPTSSIMHLHASATATNTLVAPVVAGMAIGDYLLVVNELAQTVKFVDSGTLALTGDLTLGAGDTMLLTVASTGTYSQVSTANN